MELPSITVLFFRSMSSAAVSPTGLAGAAVIGALVPLRVTVPWAEASAHQNIPLHVHRICDELIKHTCEESFAGCYFEIKLWQGCCSPVSRYWDTGLLAFISHPHRQPRIYSRVR